MTFKSWLYDRFIAHRYDSELEEITEAARGRCVAELAMSAGATVLDLGCGTGLNHPYLIRAIGPTGSIIAVDASAQMLTAARARAARGGYAAQVQFVRGDARRLRDLLVQQGADRPIDGLLITLFFSVVPSWREVFAQAFDALRAGGRCAIMDTYWQRPSLRLWMMSLRYAADPTRRGFEPLEREAGDFRLEYFPPDSGAFFIASGTKPERAK